jgi:ribosomal protein S15P/S13E
LFGLKSDCKQYLKDEHPDNKLIKAFKSKDNPLTSYAKTVTKADNNWKINDATIYFNK